MVKSERQKKKTKKEREGGQVVLQKKDGIKKVLKGSKKRKVR